MTTQETGDRAKQLSRRDFGQQAALTLVAGALASAGTLCPGEAMGANHADASHPMTPQPQASVSNLSAGAQAEIEGKMRHIFALYGDRLSEQQRKMLHGVVTDHVRMLERIRAVPAHNSDPPATVLKLIDGSGTGS